MRTKNKHGSAAGRLRPSAVIKPILIIVGALLLADAAAMSFIVNFNAGLIFTALLGTACVFIGAYFDRILKIKWLALCFSAAFLLLASLLTFISVYGVNDNADFREDAVIVPGAGIRGTEVSVQLARRLDAAVAYCGKNPDAVVVLSGGQGDDEEITEALAMECYLIEKGFPAERIIKEESSVSTKTNMVNSKAILDSRFEGEYRVVIISSGYHIYRSVSTARALGLDCTHVHSTVSWYSLPVSLLRECAAVVRLWIFGA